MYLVDRSYGQPRSSYNAACQALDPNPQARNKCAAVDGRTILAAARRQISKTVVMNDLETVIKKARQAVDATPQDNYFLMASYTALEDSLRGHN